MNGAAQSIPQFETESYLSILASDEMKGRESGTEGYLRAVDFVSSVLKSSNIQPLFTNSYIDSLFIDGQHAPNVYGYIPGDSVKQAIILGAHLDHVGQIDSMIYNGANDNASGVVALLQIARYLKQHLEKPTYPIFIVFFSAEERGLLGSTYFAQVLEKNNYKVKYMLNFEMLGRPISEEAKQKVYLVHEGTNIQRLMNQFSKKDFVIDFSFRDEFDFYLFQRSDHYPFHIIHGCPTGMFITYDGIDNDPHYHQPTDTAENIDFEHLNGLINKLAQSILQLIETDATVRQSSP